MWIESGDIVYATVEDINKLFRQLSMQEEERSNALIPIVEDLLRQEAKKVGKDLDKMIEDGLLEEVKQQYDNKIYSKAINTGIGYKELYKYFDKEVTLSGFVEKVRNLQWVQFIVLRDATGKVQITIEKSEEKNKELVELVDNLLNKDINNYLLYHFLASYIF